MKTIQLTQGQYALVDDEDFDYLNQWKWMASWNPNTFSFYATRHATTSSKSNNIRMHRLIMNTPEGLVCDHIDHNTLNNQKHNLRNCTTSENARNRITENRNNKLGVLGVTKHHKGFRAAIQKNGKKIHLPTRKTIEEATEDRRKAQEKEYGEF